MRLPGWPVLLGAAGIGGIAVGLMGRALYKEFEKAANNNNFVARAIAIMKQDPSIEQLIGDKIEIGQVKIDDFFKFKDTVAQVRLPIKGQNDKAYLYAYARKRDKKDSFKLFKLEAQFARIQGKKLVLLDRSNEHPDSDDEWEQMQSAKDKKASKDVPKEKSGGEIAAEERQRIQSMTPEERKKYFFDQIKAMDKNEQPRT